MEIFWSDTRDLDNAVSLHSGRSVSPGSNWAWSLLSYAIQSVWNCTIPEVSVSIKGKPYFPDRPDICFSLSHTNGFVMAAVSDQPIGADIQYRKTIKPALEQRLLRIPHGDLDVFEVWVLRESWYKLSGEGDLREIPFSRCRQMITGPHPDLKCRLYDDIPNCSAAVCSLTEIPSKKLLQIPASKLIRLQ